jgi:translation initiation factor IF-2
MGGESSTSKSRPRTGLNLDKLLEDPLQAEMLDLKANPTAGGRHRDRSQARPRPWSGRDRARQRGTLRRRHRRAGAEWGRVRALITDKGDHIKEAGPAMPVEVLGFNGTPEPATAFAVVENESRAREITEYRSVRSARHRRCPVAPAARFARTDDAQLKSAGARNSRWSSRATCRARSKPSSVRSTSSAPTKSCPHLHSGVGGITESDITLAEASTPRSSASTSVPTRRRARRRAWPASRSATTTSSTTSWMT